MISSIDKLLVLSGTLWLVAVGFIIFSWILQTRQQAILRYIAKRLDGLEQTRAGHRNPSLEQPSVQGQKGVIDSGMNELADPLVPEKYLREEGLREEGDLACQQKSGEWEKGSMTYCAEKEAYGSLETEGMQEGDSMDRVRDPLENEYGQESVSETVKIGKDEPLSKYKSMSFTDETDISFVDHKN